MMPRAESAHRVLSLNALLVSCTTDCTIEQLKEAEELDALQQEKGYPEWDLPNVASSNPQRLKETEAEFREAYYPDAYQYCANHVRTWGLTLEPISAIRQRLHTEDDSPKGVMYDLATAGIARCLSTIRTRIREQKERGEPVKITVRFVKKTLFHRCNDVVKRQSLFTHKRHAVLDEERETQRGERSTIDYPDPETGPLEDALIKIEEQEREQRLELLFLNDEKSERFMNGPLWRAPALRLLFDLIRKELRAPLTATRKDFTVRVQQEYLQQSRSKKRNAFDQSWDRLKKEIRNFLNSENND